MGEKLTEWFIYIIKAKDGSLYTGITTDVERRFEQHRTGKGARYFRKTPPAKVVYIEAVKTRSEATKREIEIKRMDRKSKKALILKGPHSRAS